MISINIIRAVIIHELCASYVLKIERNKMTGLDVDAINTRTVVIWLRVMRCVDVLNVFQVIDFDKCRLLVFQTRVRGGVNKMQNSH